MMDIDQSQLDSLSKRFITEVRQAFPERQTHSKFTDGLEIIFPAEHPDFGDIHVWLDGDEVTVGIGDYYHTHFETYLDDTLSKDEAEVQAVSNAIEFIVDVLAGKMILKLTYRGTMPTCAELTSTDNQERYSCVVPVSKKSLFSMLVRRKETAKSFNWFGPVEKQR